MPGDWNVCSFSATTRISKVTGPPAFKCRSGWLQPAFSCQESFGLGTINAAGLAKAIQNRHGPLAVHKKMKTLFTLFFMILENPTPFQPHPAC